MKTTTEIRTAYKCEICGNSYAEISSALTCEAKEVTYDRGVKVGDIVRITGGQRTGDLAKVTKVYITDKDWGHYAWKRYWHTVSLHADLMDGRGSRLLTFDHYELVDQENKNG